MKSKFFGSAMIVIGTTVGAGMLALPQVSVGAGFYWSVILLAIIWCVSTITGFLIIETNLALSISNCTYSTMAEKTLGTFGKILTWISYVFLLYAIVVAYVIGGSDIIVKTFNPLFQINISRWLGSLLFVCLLGFPVYLSTSAVDYLNRYLISFKGFFLLAIFVFLTPYVDISLLTSAQIGGSQIKYLWIAMPVFISSFCFHFVIPSLRIYIGDNPKQLKSLVVIGTLVSFLIYIWWLISTLGIIPVSGKYGILNMGHDASGAMQCLVEIVDSVWIETFLKGFVNAALTTSFLGASLGLFDFLADGFKINNSRMGRLKTAAMTFLPPFFFSLLYPHGFVKALNYAAIPIAVLSIILPVTMVYFLRRNTEMKSLYRVKINNFVLFLFFIFGIISIVFAILYIFDLLDKFV